MKKTFQQFIAENPHFADVQQMRETGDHSGYLRRALEKAWNAGRDSMRDSDSDLVTDTGSAQSPPMGETFTGEPTRHADLSAATREGIDKRLGATGQALE